MRIWKAISLQIPLMMVVGGFALGFYLAHVDLAWAGDIGNLLISCAVPATIGAGLGAVYPRPIRSAIIGATMAVVLWLGYIYGGLSQLR
jgi:hypothetical protein